MPMSPSLTVRSMGEEASSSASPVPPERWEASSGRVRAQIDSSALQHNVLLLQNLAPDATIMPVIKADGYGHGAARVASALKERADHFAVAAISEAVHLRERGIHNPLCVLGGVQDASDWSLCRDLGLIPVVHARWQWDQLQGLDLAPQYWLKVDTGMGRLGFSPCEAAKLAASSDQHVEKRVGLMTHLACADELDSAHVQAQLKCFKDLRGLFSPQRVSIANSAGVIGWPAIREGFVRPGLAVYGVDPMQAGQTETVASQLRPALTLEGRVMAIRRLQANDTVGYGATWTAPADTRVAVIAAGYADGVPRSLSGTAFHLRDAQGHALPLRGRISMDMLTVELPAISTVREGDWLAIWGGNGLPVQRVSQMAGTIPYELLTALGGRVQHQETK